MYFKPQQNAVSKKILNFYFTGGIMTESIHYTKKIRHQIDDDFGNQLRTPGFTFL